jgi:integrase
VSKTKRAYITFIHQTTVEWLKETYLPYRERFVRRYMNSLKALINVEEWKVRLFPFRENDIRTEIKIAMRKVLGREFRLYDLRSFFASYMVKQGVSPLIVNLLQGRTPPQQFQILQDRYLNLSQKDLQEIYDKYAPRLL